MSKVLRGRVARPWPVVLSEETPHGLLVLRPLRRRDAEQWLALRARNLDWLEEWEATSPQGTPGSAPTFAEYVRLLASQGRSGTALPFGIELDGALVGQLTVSGIAHGSLGSANIGYWIGQHVAGRGLTPVAVAMATDYAFGVVGLHRVEINIRPENGPSLRVVEKLGLREEGLRERYLHIRGEWRDHRSFAVTAEEVPDGLLARARGLWGSAQGAQ
ncbi:ribosomal-protein-alanine N-acetyltransferase [Sediminihabitans luteus]|uniref:Ribosomal-protein-alanine N-acetyltransferase n=1 Tax=Sediminihabitans luteus TaxID=1138585 RepID=A0A2M9CE40_9CELL|nr:GNAT family protein [Sediminihabitans luteus]PJJ70125.1 ribosomal-protein-alanine N-acetyltransferase [Sediminihabitans luteus]GIJ00574.1 N-acetyltransferase GCN5 [Sediminihabitans luteus]